MKYKPQRLGFLNLQYYHFTSISAGIAREGGILRKSVSITVAKVTVSRESVTVSVGVIVWRKSHSACRSSTITLINQIFVTTAFTRLKNNLFKLPESDRHRKMA
jgi:hypothetical protein